MPWIHTAVRPNGVITFCGSTCLGPTKGTLKKQNGLPYNAINDPIDSAINSPLVNKVRLAALTGEKHAECYSCWLEEKNGLSSRRQRMNKHFENSLTFDDAISLTDLDSGELTQQYEIIYFDLRLGNECNLKCRTCSPMNSSSMYDDYVAIHGETFFEDVSGRVNLNINEQGHYEADNLGYQWHKGPLFWKDFKKRLPFIKELYFAGGEPLLSSKHMELIKYCVSSKEASHIRLSYNTNLTILPKKLIELWKNFHGVDVLISLDMFGKKNTYIRPPVSWNQINQNLKLFNIHSGPNTLGRVVLTVNSLNVYYLPEFYIWHLTQNFTKISLYKSPALRFLHKPNFLNIKSLPKFTKDKIANKFSNSYNSINKKCLEIYKGHESTSTELFNRFKNELGNVINYMQSEEYPSSTFDLFIKITKKLDKINNHKIEDYLPEFLEILPNDIKTDLTNQNIS